MHQINDVPDEDLEHPAGLAELWEEIERLKTKADDQDGEISRLKSENEDLKEDLARKSDSIFFMKQRLYQLAPDLTELQKDRADILVALLKANGGKMLLKDARQKMHLSKNRFSELLASMKTDKEINYSIEVKPYHLKKSQKVIILK